MSRTGEVLATLLATLAASHAAMAGDQYPQFIEQGYRVDYMVGIGASGLAPLDIDGDGAQEVVFSALAGNAHLIAALDRQADGSFRIKHEHVVFPDDIVRILGRVEADQPRVLTVGRNGIVREYGGAPFAELRRFQTQPNALTAAIGDLDGDAEQDLVVLSSTAVLAYALSDGHLVRSHAAVGFTDMVLAQLDADPALEIVLTGDTTGRVLDGATSATEWEQPGGFGGSLAAGRFGSDGVERWAGAAWKQVDVYQPWKPAWSIAPMGFVRQVARVAERADSDLLVLDEYDALSVYEDGEKLRFRFLHEGTEISNMIGADVEGDGQNAIVFASSLSWTSYRSIGVLDIGTGQLLGEVFTDRGPYLETAVGDINGDDRQEVAAVTYQHGSRGTLVLFDLATGLPRWSSPYPWPSSESLFLPIVELIAVPRTNGGGSDLALLEQQGSLRFIDGVTLEQKWRTASAPLDSGTALALIDYDRDGIQDFVAGIRVGTSAGGQLRVLSGRDGTLLWQSVLMGGMFTNVTQVVVSDASAQGGPRQIIALLGYDLRAFDADTGLLNWTLDIGEAIVGHVSEGVSGPELIVGTSDGRLQFYDVGQAGVAPELLRQFTLPEPLNTVTALDDDVHLLLATTHDGLALIDGSTGESRAVSSAVSTFPTATRGAPSVFRHSPGSWQIIIGSDAGMYRFRLVLSESIFSDGLD